MYDIAIVGAGPAGSILAKELLTKRPEFKIAIIDGISQGGAKVCGGLLSPDAKKALSSLGIALPDKILTSPQANIVNTIDIQTGIWRGYRRDYLNMDRYAFDRYLLSLIPESAEVFSGRCLAVSRVRGGFCLKIKDTTEEFTLYAKRVAGADGASSVVRKCLFSENKIYKFASIQEWYENADPSLPDYSCIYDEETSPSCSWTIRKECYYIYGGAFIKHGCKKAFEAQKSRLEEYLGTSLGKPIKREACLVSSPRFKGDFCLGGDGAYLLGEAAGFISSSSFEGISSAITSARVLSEAILNTKNDIAALKHYRAKTRGLRFKLWTKIPKMKILTSPGLRRLIMKSGITAIKK